MSADKFYLKDPDGAKVICPECGWNGFGGELIAQKCPVCDSSVREIALSPIDLDEPEAV